MSGWFHFGSNNQISFRPEITERQRERIVLEHSMQAFLSRLLLCLGTFVVLCLLLF